MTGIDNSEMNLNPLFSKFAFDVLDELLDDDWTAREMYEYLSEWGEYHSYEEISQMFDMLRKAGFVEIRDTLEMTNKEGISEILNLYRLTAKGREFGCILYNKWISDSEIGPVK